MMTTSSHILREAPLIRASAPALLILAVLLAGCTVHGGGTGGTTASPPQARHYGTRGQKPYTIRGKTYYPLASARGYDKTGTASWYGPGFHSGKTASGDRYDQEAMTAAHTVLPFGTLLQVRNLANGKTAVVMVNDRGPFVSGRIIDLSKAAARQLGMLGSGTARVRITALEGGAPASPSAASAPAGNRGTSTPQQAASSGKPSSAVPPPARTEDSSRRPAQPEGLTLYYIQTGSFTSASHAEKQASLLRSRGFDCRVTGEKPSRVQAGPWFSRQEADKALRTLRTAYGKAALVTE